MVGSLLFFLFEKEVVFYIPHRQILPIVENRQNQKNFIFIKWNWLWKIIYLKDKVKFGYRLLYIALSILNPKYIISVNWITKKEQLFYIWCQNSKSSKFIVMQHGAYLGGLIRPDHRYLKCDKFFVWGDYYKRVFDDYNPSKKNQIINFGNPIYNCYNRNQFQYSSKVEIDKLLVAFSTQIITEEYLNAIKIIAGYPVSFDIKYHNKQKDRYNLSNKVVEGSLYEIINKYQAVAVDHSSALLDAIFFKRLVLFFNVGQKCNAYSKYLKNAYSFDGFNSIDIEAQEKLITLMVSEGDNNLRKGVNYNELANVK